MKAIGIKMVELNEMTAAEAIRKGYRVNNKVNTPPETVGYEVTYSDGYKSWCPKDVADKAYFKLDEANDGTKILEQDVNNFMASHKTTTIGPKTTVVLGTTVTGFDMVNASACVDTKNYSEKLGEKYALETIKSNLWSYLDFVLQWAKYGITNKE